MKGNYRLNEKEAGYTRRTSHVTKDQRWQVWHPIRAILLLSFLAIVVELSQLFVVLI